VTYTEEFEEKRSSKSYQG